MLWAGPAIELLCVNCPQCEILGVALDARLLDSEIDSEIDSSMTKSLPCRVGAAESSSALIAQCWSCSVARVVARGAKAFKGPYAPINLIAFIVLAIPRMAITRFTVFCTTRRDGLLDV